MLFCMHEFVKHELQFSALRLPFHDEVPQKQGNIEPHFVNDVSVSVAWTNTKNKNLLNLLLCRLRQKPKACM